MLQISVPDREYYDEIHEIFVTVPGIVLELEHSLFSISKWEAKWGKAFLGKQVKTNEEMFDYIRCMTLNKNVNPMTYSSLSQSDIQKIKDYIEAKMCATCLPQRDEGSSRDTITAELIYYWMIALQIPFECQYWHLNRLLTLIQVCNIKNNPDKHKINRSEALRRRAALNAERRAKYHTRG